MTLCGQVQESQQRCWDRILINRSISAFWSHSQSTAAWRRSAFYPLRWGLIIVNSRIKPEGAFQVWTGKTYPKSVIRASNSCMKLKCRVQQGMESQGEPQWQRSHWRGWLGLNKLLTWCPMPWAGYLHVPLWVAISVRCSIQEVKSRDVKELLHHKAQNFLT